ncbi:MAG: DUF4143 domain-containing protein [bacterium]
MIFETAVFSEIIKALIHRGENPQVYFWRTTAGSEVDIVIESGGKLVPIEVKLSATPRSGMAAGIRTFRKDFGERATTGFVIHPGDVCLPLSPKIKALPFSKL